MTKKKPTYEELIARNEQYQEQILKLKEEVDILRKSFLPEDNYYKDRFYRITENVNDVVYRMVLPEFRYDYVSPQSKELIGYDPEEFYRSPLLMRRIIHPDFIKEFIAHWRSLLKGDAPDYYEIKIIKKDGEVRWVQQKNLIIKNESGKAVAIEGIVTDITERKVTEEALINSEAQKNAILNNLPHLAWLKDYEGKYLSVNESFANSVGKAAEEIIGKTDYDLYSDNLAQKYREEDLKIVLTKKQLFFEEKTKDKWFETFKAPIFDNDERVIGITGSLLKFQSARRLKTR